MKKTMIALTLALVPFFISAQLPEVTTEYAGTITHTSAVLHGEVEYDDYAGLTNITFFQWSENPQEINDEGTPPMETFVGETADVSATITGLKPGRVYYYRFCFTTAGITIYGDTRWFHTDNINDDYIEIDLDVIEQGGTCFEQFELNFETDEIDEEEAEVHLKIVGFNTGTIYFDEPVPNEEDGVEEILADFAPLAVLGLDDLNIFKITITDTESDVEASVSGMFDFDALNCEDDVLIDGDLDINETGDACYFEVEVDITNCFDSLKVLVKKVGGATILDETEYFSCTDDWEYGFTTYGAGYYKVVAKAYTLYDVWQDAETIYYDGAACGRLENSTDIALQVYPNPATDFISTDAGFSGVEIDNLAGISMSLEYINENTISVKNFPNGMYIIHFENGEMVKFIKQ